MNRIVLVVYLLFQFSVSWSQSLDVPIRDVVAKIPIGYSNGALSYIDSDQYEPEGPCQIVCDSAGHFYILDFHQGVLHYTPNFQYIDALKSIGRNKIILTDNYLAVWTTGYGDEPLTVWGIRSHVFQQPITFSNIYKSGLQVFGRANYVFYYSSPENIQGLYFDNQKLTPIINDDISKTLAAINLSFNNGVMIDNNIGIITERAERFFLINAQELVFAQVGIDRDSVNMARGQIFAIDAQGRRYIFYKGDGKARIAIAESNGRLLKVMDILAGRESGLKLTVPCLDPNGNIYYIESNPQGHKVISIKKNW